VSWPKKITGASYGPEKAVQSRSPPEKLSRNSEGGGEETQGEQTEEKLTPNLRKRAPDRATEKKGAARHGERSNNT
jgi:hypothetical protein